MPQPVEGDWASQVADLLDRVVEAIRTKTVEPITKVARAVVYGIVVATMGVVALVLISVAAVRGVDILIPGPVWSAHLVVGGTFTVAGLLAWSRRSPRKGTAS